VSERFWSKVRKGDGCWEWQASLKGGYGQFGHGGLAHRVSWEMTRGPIPNGLYVCHRCDNRRCVNPDHLFLGTQRDNMSDAARKGRTAKGERQGHAKLTAAAVAEIRSLHLAGVRQKEIAALFGLAKGHTNRIVHRAAWAHV